MSECSSMAQGGEKGESIEDLVCFFFNKISTSISPASSFGSILRSFVICFCFNYPASGTSSSLNFSVKFDWITSSGDLGNEGGAWSARAEHYFWNYSSFLFFDFHVCITPASSYQLSRKVSENVRMCRKGWGRVDFSVRPVMQFSRLKN